MASALTHGAVALALGACFDRTRVPSRALVAEGALAVVPGLAAAWAYARAAGPAPDRRWLGLYFALVLASHGLLDALTNGGPGIAFFSPFSNTRYFFPFRPIEVSPISVGGIFNARGLRILASELRWVWLPAGLLAACGLLVRRARRRPGPKAA